VAGLRAALILFVVAGSSGILFRHAAAFQQAFSLSLAFVRHAHSHLMYMGWGTPALAALLLASAAERGGADARPALRLGRWALWASVVLAALAFPSFLFFGYTPVVFGQARLPLSAMLGGVAMLAWYGVAVAWLRAARGTRRDVARTAWDAALATLAFSTVGAWMQASSAIQPLNPVLHQASLHLFLDLFGGGWFVFGALALAFEAAPELDRPGVRRALLGAAVTVPFTFLLAVPGDMMSGTGALVRHGAAGAAGLCLLYLAQAGLRSRAARAAGFIAPGVMLVLHAGSLVAATSPALLDAGVQAGLRVLYLHVTFLGVLTLSVFAAAEARWGLRGRRAMTAVVVLLIATLVPLTWLWPEAWGGAWRFPAAEAGALGPVVVALYALIRGFGRPA